MNIDNFPPNLQTAVNPQMASQQIPEQAVAGTIANAMGGAPASPQGGGSRPVGGMPAGGQAMPPMAPPAPPQPPFNPMKQWAQDKEGNYVDLETTDLPMLMRSVAQNPKASQFLQQQAQNFGKGAGDKRKDTLIGVSYLTNLLK